MSRAVRQGTRMILPDAPLRTEWTRATGES